MSITPYTNKKGDEAKCSIRAVVGLDAILTYASCRLTTMHTATRFAYHRSFCVGFLAITLYSTDSHV